jgi:Mg/Co/Ni transporter MgtE
MEPEERQEVSELLAFQENTDAGRMTTEYIALSSEHTVGDAIDRLRSFEGATENINTIYLVDSQEKLLGSVPLVSLVLAPGATRLGALAPDHVIYAEANASDKEVAEMFDKYNLLTLPVVDDQHHLAGIITADDIISLLRDRI